jgi:hypothetical protein
MISIILNKGSNNWEVKYLNRRMELVIPSFPYILNIWTSGDFVTTWA